MDTKELESENILRAHFILLVRGGFQKTCGIYSLPEEH
jgi:hypothetical protein